MAAEAQWLSFFMSCQGSEHREAGREKSEEKGEERERREEGRRVKMAGRGREEGRERRERRERVRGENKKLVGGGMQRGER